MFILQTIMSRGFGTLGKIFLEYEDKWWWEGCEGIHLVWTKDIPDFEYTASPHQSQQQVNSNMVFVVGGEGKTGTFRAHFLGKFMNPAGI